MFAKMPRLKKQVKRQHANVAPIKQANAPSRKSTKTATTLSESDSEVPDPTMTNNDDDDGSEVLPSSSSEGEPDNPDDESFQEEASSSSSEEDEHVEEKPRARRRTATNTATSKKAASRRSKNNLRRKSVLEWSEGDDASEEEEATFSESSQDEEEANPPKRRGRPPNKRNTKPTTAAAKRSAATRKQAPPTQRKPTRATARSRQRRTANRALESSSSSEEKENSNSNDDVSDATPPIRSPAGRIQRSSARKARQGIVQHTQADMHESSASEEEQEEENGDGDDKERSPMRTSQRKRMAMLTQTKKKASKKKKDDDEDFIADSDEDEEDDEIVSEGGDPESEMDEEIVGTPEASSDEEGVGQKNHSNSKANNNVDEEIIGTQDDSSDNDEEPITRRQSSELEISPVKRERPADDGAIASSSQESPGLPDCPSTEDAITMEKLPKRHVCFVSRSGSRQCFDLLTLRKIATSSALHPTREALDGSQKATYLQPPHFRAPMDDDLLDQIASRFGRAALDLNGPYYCQPTAASSDETNQNPEDDVIEIDDDENDNGFNQGYGNENFLDLVEKYARSQMGSQDLYVCPLCFCVAQDRFIRENHFTRNCKKAVSKNDPESLRTNYLLEKDLQDPIAVLRAMDKSYHRELEIASTFCSTKVSSLKEHIREDHGLDTKVVEGNTLYARYKIRVQDGILQRYLFNTRGNLTQGVMSQ